MLDEFARELATYVRRVMQRVEYVGLAPATVQSQSGQLLELVLDPPTSIPKLVDVPIRHGLPGVTAVVVAAGTRVRVGFDGGDPRKPFAVLWDAGNATSVTFNASTRQLARTNDTTADGTLSFAASAGPAPGTSTLTITYAPPGAGAPQVVGIVLTGAASIVPATPGPIALGGTITGSSMIRG